MLPTQNPDGSAHDLPRLIEVLNRHGVEYLIVGGAAAYAYGAKRPTEDIDCVVRRDRANLDRLVGALRELHARLRWDDRRERGGRTGAPTHIVTVSLLAAGVVRSCLSQSPSTCSAQRTIVVIPLVRRL
jgi:hypothetical protein